MLRQPILIYAADAAGIRRYERAMAPKVEQLSISKVLDKLRSHP